MAKHAPHGGQTGGGDREALGRQAFERTVTRVLDDIPKDFREMLSNVEVVVCDRPTEDELKAQGVGEGALLLGLYKGIPLPRRGYGYSLVLPDQICIYREPIEKICRGTGEPEAEMIKKVVLHEVAHHFGIPDKRLRELGY